MVEDIKYCNKCGSLLIIGDNWTLAKQRKSTYQCLDCDKINRNTMTFEDRLRLKISRSLHDHRKKGIEVIGSITEYTHTYTGECAYCGEEFDIFSSNRHRTGSIDRKSNSNIMTPDDVQWLCNQCNRTKADRSHEEFIEYVKTLYKKYGGGE